MKIALILNANLPVVAYGGTERVVWHLAKALHQKGHSILLMNKNTTPCSFAETQILRFDIPLQEQLPKDVDLVHFHSDFHLANQIEIPYAITLHGNYNSTHPMDKNTIFVSKNHAQRYGSTQFVYNGLDWDSYLKPNFEITRQNFHFLGNAAWRVKNVKGAIATICEAKERIDILGGARLNFNMGFRFTITPRAHFHGMVGGVRKEKILQQSKGLVFPVRWHEPFGLAIIESLYFGCPVFGTPYGSLPELVLPEFGFLSNSQSQLADALHEAHSFNKKHCYAYARDAFSADEMAENYLQKYQQILQYGVLHAHPPKLLQEQQAKFLPWQK